MEALDKKLAELVEKLSDAGFDNAPEMIELGAIALYWDGVIQLVFFFIALLIFLAALGWLLFILGSPEEEETNGHLKQRNEDHFEKQFMGWASLIWFIIMFMIGVIRSPWLKVIDSKAALVSKLFF